jgi:hypothetical protein
MYIIINLYLTFKEKQTDICKHLVDDPRTCMQNIRIPLLTHGFRIKHQMATGIIRECISVRPQDCLNHPFFISVTTRFPFFSSLFQLRLNTNKKGSIPVHVAKFAKRELLIQSFCKRSMFRPVGIGSCVILIFRRREIKGAFLSRSDVTPPFYDFDEDIPRITTVSSCSLTEKKTLA